MTEQTKDMTTHEKVDFYVAAARIAEKFVNSQDDTVSASDYFPEGLASHAEALDWFDAQHANLLAAQCAATRYGWHEAVWSLAESLTAFHHRRGSLRALLAVWHNALASAEYLADPVDSATTTAHRLLGDTYAAVGWHDEAIYHLAKALNLAIRRNDLDGQASTHFILAIAHERNEDEESAREHATQALAHYRALDNKIWEAATRNMVGWYAARADDYDEAREHAQASLDLHREHRDPAGEARALGTLGYVHRHTDNHTEAVAHYLQALAVFRDLGHTFGVAGTLEELGDTYADEERYDEARAARQEALELYRKQGRNRAAEDIQKLLDEE